MMVIPIRVTERLGSVLEEVLTERPVTFEDAQLIISHDKVECAEDVTRYNNVRQFRFHWGYKPTGRS